MTIFKNQLDYEVDQLRIANPDSRFRIAVCEQSGEELIQLYHGNSWLCLHADEDED